MIDAISKRYGLLPSECMAKATTFDMFIMDATLNYENYRSELSQTGRAPAPKLSQKEMMDMLAKVRSHA